MSLVEQVLGYFKQSSLSITPHIVTRIDRNTSGIVIFTKHGFIHHLMSQTQVDKRYLCICHGNLKNEGLIDAPIARDPSSIIQRQVNVKGKEARTRFKCLQYSEDYSLSEVHLLTGRTHQIRVHFQHIGYPLVGDDLYGGKDETYHHQLLRCIQISFIHPIKKQKIIINDRYDTIETIFNMI